MSCPSGGVGKYIYTTTLEGLVHKERTEFKSGERNKRIIVFGNTVISRDTKLIRSGGDFIS